MADQIRGPRLPGEKKAQITTSSSKSTPSGTEQSSLLRASKRGIDNSTGEERWTRDLFIRNGQLYAYVLEAKREEGIAIAKEINDFLRSEGIEQGNILDIPCGTGRVSIPLSIQHRHNVVGVDLSPHLVEMASKKDPNGKTRFLVGDMQNLSELFKDKKPGSFDAAINVFTSIGYGTEEDDMIFFRSLRELVRDNGFFIIHTLMNKDYLNAHFDENPIGYIDAGKLMVYETRQWDRETSHVTSKREFYEKIDHDFNFLGESRSDMRIYSPEEVMQILSATGWRPICAFDNLSDKRKVTPETMRFVVVARAN